MRLVVFVSLCGLLAGLPSCGGGGGRQGKVCSQSAQCPGGQACVQGICVSLGVMMDSSDAASSDLAETNTGNEHDDVSLTKPDADGDDQADANAAVSDAPDLSAGDATKDSVDGGTDVADTSKDAVADASKDTADTVGDGDDDASKDTADIVGDGDDDASKDTAEISGDTVDAEPQACSGVRPEVTERIVVQGELIYKASDNSPYQLAFVGSSLYVGTTTGVVKSAIGANWNFLPVAITNYTSQSDSNDAATLGVAGDRLLVGVARANSGAGLLNLFILNTNNDATVHSEALDENVLQFATDPANAQRVIAGTRNGMLFEGLQTFDPNETWTFTRVNNNTQTGAHVASILFASTLIVGTGFESFFYEWNSQQSEFLDTSQLGLNFGTWPAAMINWRPEVSGQEMLFVGSDFEAGNTFAGVYTCAVPCRTPSAAVGNSTIVGGGIPSHVDGVGSAILLLLPDNRIVTASAEYLWVAEDAANPADLKFKLVLSPALNCSVGSYFDAKVHGSYLYVSARGLGVVRFALDQLK